VDARERFALTSLTDLLREGYDPGSARDFLTDQVGMAPELVARAVELYEDLAKGVREMREPRVLHDGTRVPQPWYPGPSPKDVHWPALEQHLGSKPTWNGTPLETLDRSSSKVVAYLEPPYAKEIRTRGLVVGYVQSGKTSNFTAVISKAADAGYRLFIVLSGIHNNLRRQTQLRLDEQLVDLNHELWIPLTTLDRDFGSPIRATPLLAQPALRLLAVVKKNGKRLERLIGWLQRANDDGILQRCPVLVIDDEADQASPNSKKAAEKRATINGLIIKLLDFPRVAYVGYTATPFANFFIDPQFQQDLYPRHFIIDLPRSPDYFGPESLFGREPRTPDEPEPETIDMIRDVDRSELPSLVPPRKKGERFTPAVTASLRAAIRWFLLSATARRIRDGEPRHTTMLIHTSERVAVHELLWQPVVDEILGLDSALGRGDPDTIAELVDQWTAETAKVDGTTWGHAAIAADHVVSGVRQTIALLGTLTNRAAEDCGVVVDNSFSPRRLIYDDDNPLPVIVIGGNTLSRGLTLEGLVSSFFVRSAGTYDTLLQMGRWFGYRRGYEDLPRMWVTPTLKTQFRFLAGVEEQIREEIRRYEDEGLIPAQVPVRVQTNPALGLAITAVSKMRGARDLKMSYSGQRPQTILFKTDPAWLQQNLDAAKTLIREQVADGSDVLDRRNRLVLRDVPVDAILKFLDKGGYQFHESNTELQRDTVTGYIKSQNEYGELTEWNIAIVSRLDDPFGTADIGAGRSVNLIGRSKLRDASTDDTANIGILTNQVDWVADLDIDDASTASLTALKKARTDSERAVLLIYPIARNSPARTAKGESGNDKVDLDVSVDVVGVAIAFPQAKVDPTPQNYKVVRLPNQLVADLGREEVEETEDEEAAEQDDEFINAVEREDGEESLDNVEAPA
jgi:hypothetical protein